MTLSPTWMSSGTRSSPSSFQRPGPTARTSPSWGFSLAVSGMTRPDAVVCSASTDLTTMRSSSGLMETDTVDLPFGTVGIRTGGGAYVWCDRRARRRRGDRRARWCGWHLREASANQNLGLRLALGQLECQNAGSDPVRKDGAHGSRDARAPRLRRGLGAAAVAPAVRRGL